MHLGDQIALLHMLTDFLVQLPRRDDAADGTGDSEPGSRQPHIELVLRLPFLLADGQLLLRKFKIFSREQLLLEQGLVALQLVTCEPETFIRFRDRCPYQLDFFGTRSSPEHL